MAAVSRPVAYGGLAVVLIAAYWSYSQDDAPASHASGKKPTAAAPKTQASDFTKEDYAAHFDAPKFNTPAPALASNAKPAATATPKMRNIFVPLVVAGGDKPVTDAPKDPDEIPADLANSEAGWINTGYAVIDGASVALLENVTTHRTGLVKLGETWKTSHLSGVTAAGITLVGKDGVAHVILRHRPKDETSAGPGGKGPNGAPGGPGGRPGMSPGMSGPGGPGGPGGPPGGPSGPIPMNPGNFRVSGPISVGGGAVSVSFGD